MITTCVVMVSYHTGPILFASINSVLAQSGLGELIVVDNGNTPDVLARLRQLALSEPRLRVITGHGNIGYAKGCNLGAKQANGYFLMLLNPDCLLPPNAIERMMQAFDVQSDAAMVGATTINPRGKPTRDYMRPLLTFKTLFKRGTEAQKTSHEQVRIVPAISGACMCLRRKDYERLGGMDEAFFAAGAGMDLCMRVRKVGGRTLLASHVRITRLNTDDYSKRRTLEWYRYRGLVHYFAKHFTHHYPLGFMLIVHTYGLLTMSMRVALHWLRVQLRPSYAMSHTIPAKRLMVLASGLTDLPQTSELKGKTVLVTGATSQLGLSVCKHMIAAGAGVLAISRQDPIPFEHEHLRWIKGDLTDEALHLDDYLADVVIHCAPLWHLPPTLALLKDAEVKHVIAFGSTSVFGKVLSKNLHERELVEQLARAEREIADRSDQLGMTYTIIRPTMTYGVGLDLNITSLAKLISFLGFFPVYPPAIGKRQPTHVDDLGMAAVKLVNNRASHGKSYNVSGGEVLTYRAMVERIFSVCGKKLRIEENTTLPFILDVAGFLSGKKHINGEIARRMNDDLMFFHDDAERDFGYHGRRFLSGGMKDIEGY
ncbi:MAG: glycosyltransferase [Rickettsiales bacterium]|jgi:GT2 family glycosyltransferase/nucleoside-diphosphate-sugar epimerase|nr:glycosyltransferase [Rickettsiales bacterium]